MPTAVAVAVVATAVAVGFAVAFAPTVTGGAAPVVGGAAVVVPVAGGCAESTAPVDVAIGAADVIDAALAGGSKADGAPSVAGSCAPCLVRRA